MKSPKSVQTCRTNLVSFLMWRLDGSFFVVIQNQQELVAFSLSTGSVQLHLIALLAFKDCLLEGGTGRKGNALDALEVVRDGKVRLKVIRDGKVRLVSTEGDE